MTTRLRGAAVTVGLSVLVAGCGGHVVAGTPRGAPSAGTAAFCEAVAAAAKSITLTHGDLRVVLRSYERMDAAAPAAVEPDTGYVVAALRHAFAVRQMPDMAVLAEHTKAVTRWSAAHCGRG